MGLADRRSASQPGRYRQGADRDSKLRAGTSDDSRPGARTEGAREGGNAARRRRHTSARESSLRRGLARTLSARADAGLSRTVNRPPVRRRPIESHLSARNSEGALRHAQEAARHSAPVGASGRARISHHQGARGDRRAGPARAPAVRRRRRHRHRVLRDGLCRGTHHARSDDARARARASARPATTR